MAPNFDACAADFAANISIYSAYIWRGPISTLTGDRKDLMTLEGCYAICGYGNDYYPWSQASDTILTWIMPMLSLLVTAPFTAASGWKSVSMNILRWAGSPISSLSYILWNIKVTGKCALVVDMASAYKMVPKDGSHFSDVRDSM
jgi:hypothetical protein